MKKKTLLAATATALLAATTLLPTATTFAATSVSAPKVSYEGSGIVELDFTKDVELRSNATVTVKDTTGKTYTTVIRDDDGDDELELKVKNYTAGTSYTYKITGIRTAGQTKYTTVSGTFQIPTKKLVIEKSKYASGKVEVDFTSDVQFRHNVAVQVKDTDGNSYTAKILDKDDDELTFRIVGAKAGKTYQYTIVGVRTAGTTTYQSISGKVSAPSSTALISKAKAKSIALTKAGLTAAQVTKLKVELDKDDNLYEVEFTSGSWEYEFEINATTGKIITWEKDKD